MAETKIKTRTLKEKLGDYFLARDIIRSYSCLENKTIEGVIDDYARSRITDSIISAKKRTDITCSIVPNLLDCAGMGLALYYQSALPFLSLGAMGESIRVAGRTIAKTDLERANNALDSIINQVNSLYDAAENSFSDLDIIDEGEEWKRGGK